MIGCGRAERTSWPAPAAKFDEYAYRQQQLCLILKTCSAGCFGRLGSSFGAVHYGFTPDVMVLSEQLTSSYMPLAAVVFSERVYDAIADNTGKIGTFGHGFTASGHPVAAAVGLESLKIIEERDLIGNAARVGRIFHERLATLSAHPLVGEVRGVGLIAGVEMVADKAFRRSLGEIGKAGSYAFAVGHKHGLIVRAIGDTLALCPPLIINEPQVHDLVERLEKTLDDTARWVRSENLT